MKAIDVRGKEFKIDLVNNYCQRLYADELLPAAMEQGTILQGIEKDAFDALAGKTGQEKIAELKKQAQIINEKKTREKELRKKIYELQYEIIQELLESNDYEFDRKWWERRTDPNDINDFILLCLQPEYEIVKKSKKKVL